MQHDFWCLCDVAVTVRGVEGAGGGAGCRVRAVEED